MHFEVNTRGKSVTKFRSSCVRDAVLCVILTFEIWVDTV